jgi:hypothetical protein
MTASPNPVRPPAESPSWPFDWLWPYTHLARDFGAYARAVTRSTDAMEAIHAEADFGAKLFADMMRSYFDLAIAPWTAVASVMAERAEQAPPEAPPRPTRRRGGR